MDETLISPPPWRTGTKVGRTIYAGGEWGVPGSGHLIGVMDTAEDAAYVVALVNADHEVRLTAEGGEGS